MALPAFTPIQRDKAHRLLAAKVARMMQRKLEEDDWTEVYCRAKGIEKRGWSNLEIDVMHGGLGVEQKMLCRKSNRDLEDYCGEWLMHPSATRAFDLPAAGTEANAAMLHIFKQYAALIEKRTQKVRDETGVSGPIDMRTGWLLWQDSLRQFLYFEESMQAPNPKQYFAEWKEHRRTGARRSTRNLWIYDKVTGGKRFSVTVEAGAKIQPYFQVPPNTDPNLYLFTVIGEVILDGKVRCWLTQTTWEDLERLLGKVNSTTITQAIERHVACMPAAKAGSVVQDPAIPLEISAETYDLLKSRLPGVNDDHCFQLLVRLLRENK